MSAALNKQLAETRGAAPEVRWSGPWVQALAVAILVVPFIFIPIHWSVSNQIILSSPGTLPPQ